MDRIFDALIIGGGAAGLSAALTLGRACRSVLICDDGRPRNRAAKELHGFLTREGTPPEELLKIARADLEQYPSVSFLAAHAAQVTREADAFEATTLGGERIRARTVLLAMGVYDALPPVPGLSDVWGRSVFVCPYCDGWELRKRRVAVLGKGKRAVELAQELYQWTTDLLVCMDGEDGLTPKHQRWLERTGAEVRREALSGVEENGGGVRLNFEQGKHAAAEALFLCAPLRQRYPLVEMLGCTIDEDGNIEADDRGRTRARGVYAAGDCVTNVHQVILAAASGVCAAMALNEDLLAADVERLSL
ncbi:MAG TPA: NAD(P)/FAD-dependent oxidoreductase [Candidatus Baltobacteraceae bacterium]|nr:NAD(P)/FAD-dependent oxidoreductase [Candidatus Baltobacteraceae bacterium]